MKERHIVSVVKEHKANMGEDKARIATRVVERVPKWATSYLMYGDESALNPGDKEEVDRWLEELSERHLRLVEPIEGSDCEFCIPAFGLKCDTLDWVAEVTTRLYKVKIRKVVECQVEIRAYSKAAAKRFAKKRILNTPYGWTLKSSSIPMCEEVKAKGQGEKA